jgi:formylglycine-generating enzyme required for sulfatase activity
MDVFQCPECELRFANASEMESHLKTDHPNFHIDWSSVDEYIAATSRRRHHEHERRYRPNEDA